ncbi:MAG: DUF6603 domain-containing protein, partial [Bdellovibrionota bacterium]
MGDTGGTLEQLAEGLALMFLPLEELLAVDNLPMLLLELGLDKPVDLGSDAVFAQKLTDAVQRVLELPTEIEALIAATDNDDTGGIIDAAGKLIESCIKLGVDLDAIATDLKRATQSSTDAAEIAAFAEQFVERLLEASIVRYLEIEHPIVLQVFVLIGLVESELLPNLVDDAPVRRRRIYLERFGQLFGDLLAYLKTAYGWGDNTFQAVVLFKRISALLESVGLLAGSTEADADGPEGLQLFVIDFLQTTGVNPPGIEGLLNYGADISAAVPLAQLSDNWRLELDLKGSFAEGLAVRLLPPAHLEVQPPPGGAIIQGDAGVALIGENPVAGSPLLLFGETGGSRLQAKRISASIGAGLKWNATTGQAAAEFGFEVKFTAGKLIIDMSKADGFLAKLFPSDGVSMSFDFDMGWASDRGFFFTGGAALELAFAIDLTLGPIDIKILHLVLGIASDKLRIEVSVDATGSIGPVSASVERIGVEADLAFTRGNLGPVDLGIGFKFPAGLGINIAAGPITGGGFIEFDQPNGRYAGVLALSLYSIQIKAIGLLDTKLPNGESGYSFLVIISVEFTPIQLGFGFTLNGVGGLCGINRDFVTDAIQAGLRAHSIDHILFPKDPVKNAPAIISDLRAIFPPAEGRYVFGPMLELGWGGGLNLVTAELGVILAIPSPV